MRTEKGTNLRYCCIPNSVRWCTYFGSMLNCLYLFIITSTSSPNVQLFSGKKQQSLIKSRMLMVLPPLSLIKSKTNFLIYSFFVFLAFLLRHSFVALSSKSLFSFFFGQKTFRRSKNWWKLSLLFIGPCLEIKLKSISAKKSFCIPKTFGKFR